MLLAFVMTTIALKRKIILFPELTLPFPRSFRVRSVLPRISLIENFDGIGLVIENEDDAKLFLNIRIEDDDITIKLINM